MKKTVTFTIDDNLWELAKNKLPTSRSQFIENQIRLAVEKESDEAKLIHEISKLQDEINVKQSQLCQIREQKRLQQTTEIPIQIKETLTRFHKARGFVAENQLKQLSRTQDVDYDIIYNEAIRLGLEIRAYYEPEHETRKRNGGGLK